MTNKIIKEGEHEYIFIWHGDYPASFNDRNAMYKDMSEKNKWEKFAEYLYLWENKKWIQTKTRPDNVTIVHKIQKRLFDRKSKQPVHSVFGFSKSGFAIYINKESEKNQNKGAVCQNKIKSEAIRTFQRDILRIDVDDPNWVLVNTWLDGQRKEFSCVAIELLLYEWDISRKEDKRYYLDKEEFFWYQHFTH